MLSTASALSPLISRLNLRKVPQGAIIYLQIKYSLELTSSVNDHYEDRNRAFFISNSMDTKQKDKLLVKKMALDGKEVKMVIKSLPITEVKVVDEEAGIIEAYVSIFGNVDSYGDIVVQGAFRDSLAKYFPRYPKGVWSHDWAQPIAKTLEAREDERGLYIKAQLLLDIQKAKEAYVLIKEGVMTDFSFGYEVDDYEMDFDKGVRYLKRLTIYEWSPVLVGANRSATLIGVKGDGQIIEEEEQEQKEEPKAEPEAVVEEKAGRVLSEKNVNLVKDAIGGLDEMVASAKSLKKMFEDLIESVEQPSSGDDGKSQEEGITAVDQHDRGSVIKGALLRDARQVVKAGNRLILRVKQEQKKGQ